MEIDRELDGARRESERNQRAAADPRASAWVSANAGTGKTHVLSMRLLRLLISGTAPERILALTFTKAAAAEMSQRVFRRLGAWVTAGDAELERELTELLDRPPTKLEIERARRLFAIAIDAPGGLKVQTIHAFCERLLKRFPMEAGVPPQFAILDEHERRALIRQAIDALLAEASGGDGPLSKALAAAIPYAAEDGFDTLLIEALQESDWLSEAAPLAGTDLRATEAVYRQAIGLAPEAERAATERRLCEQLSDADLTRFIALLSAGADSDRKGSERLKEAAAAKAPRGRIEALRRFFLTDKGEERKSLMTKPLALADRQALARLKAAQGEFIASMTERLKLQLLEAALALVALAGAVQRRYSDAKARRAALDFDDLIAKAAALLGSSTALEWVLYKLDGGLDHILVDEAQDTSGAQWQVIRPLAEEFFAGAGAEQTLRTLFAVGDEKQSIYGFQGAAPAMFAEMGRAFARKAERAGLAFRRVPLSLSFRAVAPLLAAVDAVFASDARTPGVTAEKPVKHFAHRAGQAGLIEIWPIERKDKAKPADAWAPLAEASQSSSVARLAFRIAATIAGWLGSGEILESEGRPVRAGDILILVRKRAPFAAAMISALKARGIPVAGADRLVLTDEIAVKDLMALGDFLLLPDDDLALATILKSPLFGLDDDDLTALAPGRSASLWQELLSAGNARFAAAAATLNSWRTRAEHTPPFEFYASLLDGEGMRRAMLQRLGAEAGEAIDEFLNLALGYDERAPPSLQGFLSFLREDIREIKRDMEQGRDEVRVMTVHGAKGLEAPIVFLPDTLTTRSARGPFSLIKLALERRPPGVPAPLLWPVRGTGSLEVVEKARAAIDRAEAEERHRLLYVALTRARDRLYVAGFEGGSPAPADCWYNVISLGLAGSLEEAVDGDGRSLLRKRAPQSARQDAGRAPAESRRAALPLPPWALAAAPPALLARPLAPARLAPLRSSARRGEPAVLPPAALAEGHRFLRGTLTHALLEHLPALPQERREAAAAAFIAKAGPQLSPSVRRDIVRETLAILRDPEFAALFSPHARAEVAIVAEIPRQGAPALRLQGKIDRMVAVGRSLLIVDYKTNRPPPRDAADVADAYLLQLAAYRLAAKTIFAGFTIRAAILWTDGPRMMEICSALLDLHERALLRREPASLDA